MTALAANTGIKRYLKTFKEKMLDFPLFILSSPFKGFDEVKTQKRGSKLYTVLILLLLGLVTIWSQVGTGFIITGFYWEVPSVNMFWVLSYTYAPIALICVANWSITSITNGNGKLKEIFQVYCYALFPSIICQAIAIVLSNYVTANETAFVMFFFAFGQITLYFYLFIGLVVIHEYSFFRSIFMVVLTVFAMLIIVFVMVLFVSLVSELIFFIMTLVVETEAHLL
jgi:hypothetical protein